MKRNDKLSPFSKEPRLKASVESGAVQKRLSVHRDRVAFQDRKFNLAFLYSKFTGKSALPCIKRTPSANERACIKVAGVVFSSFTTILPSYKGNSFSPLMCCPTANFWAGSSLVVGTGKQHHVGLLKLIFVLLHPRAGSKQYHSVSIQIIMVSIKGSSKSNHSFETGSF